MSEICVDCQEKPAANGHRCWACSDRRRRDKAACVDCQKVVKRGTLRCRACHLARLHAEQSTASARQAMSERTKGIPKSEPTKERMREAAKQRDPARYEKGASKRRGRPSGQGAPVGTERVSRGRVLVKCEDGKWRYRYQRMWEAKHGPVPKGFMIHHINFDPMDDRDDNFRLMTKGDHTKLHRIWEASAAYQPKKE